MSAPFSGGCVCGAIRYESAEEPTFVAHCHCRDCQKISGGAMGTFVMIPKAGFKLLKGKPKSYRFVADSGNEVFRDFCGDCGTPLFSELKGMPDAWVVKAASLDDPSWLKPAMHIYTDSAQPWDKIPDDLPRAPGMPG